MVGLGLGLGLGLGFVPYVNFKCNPLKLKKGMFLPGARRGGGTWVSFFWVCAAGLSEPLPHYSLCRFCDQL